MLLIVVPYCTISLIGYCTISRETLPRSSVKCNKEMQPEAALIWIVFSSSNVFYNILHYINNKYVCMSLKAKHMKLPQHQYRPLGATQGLFMDTWLCWPMGLERHKIHTTCIACFLCSFYVCYMYVCTNLYIEKVRTYW